MRKSLFAALSISMLFAGQIYGAESKPKIVAVTPMPGYSCVKVNMQIRKQKMTDASHHVEATVNVFASEDTRASDLINFLRSWYDINKKAILKSLFRESESGIRVDVTLWPGDMPLAKAMRSKVWVTSGTGEDVEDSNKDRELRSLISTTGVVSAQIHEVLPED